jgi:rhodanese-related sulfurtransferase
MSADLMSPLRVVSRIKNGEKIHLVDVRSPGEFNAVHAEGAILCPLDTLNPRQLAQQLGLSSTAPAALLCASGNRAKKASEKFLAEGIPYCLVVEGGTQAWEAAGLSVITGKGLSLLNVRCELVQGPWFLLGSF